MFSASSARNLLRGLYYGWWVLLASMAVQILTSGFTLQAFGVYIAVMQEEFGWSKTSFSAAFAIQQAFGGFLGPVIGWLIGRFGTRYVIRVGIVIFAVGVLLMSLVQSLVHLYAVVIVIAIGASFAGFLPLNTVAVQWFDRWRSTALALMQTGISLGGLLVPLIAWAIAILGWRSSLVVTAGLVLLIGIPISFIIGNRPEDYGLSPDGAAGTSASYDKRSSARDFTAREALKTRAFWFIGLGHATALMVVFAVLAHLVVYLRSELGFSLQLAGYIVAVMTVASIVGQLLGGFLGDRYSKRAIAFGAMFGHASGLVMLVYGATLVWVVAFAVTHGLAWGLRGPIMQSIRADYFGRTHFGQIMGLSSVIVTLGIVAGPLIAGTLADYFGSYRIGLSILAVLAALGSVFFALAAPPESQESQA